METEKTGLEVMYTERYEACFGLYLQYNGTQLTQIEREMRSLGYPDFHRRILYSRTERGIKKPGWIEKFGWREHLAASSPPSKGGEFSAGNAGVHACMSAKHEQPSVIHDRRDDRGSTPPEDGSVAGGDACGPVGAEPAGIDFPAWLKEVSPELTWDWEYQKYIYKHLERVTNGTCKRLMIFMPPRHGKSELVSVRYAGWRLWNDPKLKVIVSSYNQKLADKFSRSIRRLLSEEEDRQTRLQKPAREQGLNTAAEHNCLPCAPTFPREPGRSPTGNHASHSPAGLTTQSDGGLCSSCRRFPAAVPPDVRKGSAFPEVSQNGSGGSASDVRQRQSADHPQCTGGIAADHICGPNGKAQPFRTSGGGAAEQTFQPNSETATPHSALPRMFPPTRTINTASQWETAVGGGVKAVGAGAGVTGFGGQLIVIDDPVKSRAEAESSTYRERLWDWYRNDLYTRLEPNAAVILIQTRWHQDDLAGRLLQEMDTGGDQWEVIDLPALAEARVPPHAHADWNAGVHACMSAKHEQPAGIHGSGDDHELTPPEDGSVACGDARGPVGDGPGGDPLGRLPGEALCRDRFDEAKLADIQRQLGGYPFSALYQQRPIPAEGGIFKREWFTKFADKAPDGLRWKRGYDLAVSTKTTACFTASVRVAVDKSTGNMYIADCFRERIEYPEQKRFILGRVMAERNTDHGIEKALHGEALIQELRRDAKTFGKFIRGITVTADKVTRALTWAPLAEEGKVILVRGTWNRTFLDELANFPAGQHDDQIDAVSIAVSMLAEQRKRVYFL